MNEQTAIPVSVDTDSHQGEFYFLEPSRWNDGIGHGLQFANEAALCRPGMRTVDPPNGDIAGGASLVFKKAVVSGAHTFNGSKTPGSSMRSLLLLMATTVAPAFAAESALPDDFNALFASTCLQYYYSQDTLRARMESQGVEILPPDQAEFFLSGGEGTAWLFVAPSTRYVVSLSEDSICSVFAQRGNPEQIQAGFLELVGTAPPPLVVQMPDTARLGVNTEVAKTIARSWARPTDEEALMFVLTTSSSEEATAQAVASMALVTTAK